MIVKCWSCKTDFEVVSSAENRTPNPSAAHIIEVLQDNMFDVQRGGTMVIRVEDFIEELAEILEQHL